MSNQVQLKEWTVVISERFGLTTKNAQDFPGVSDMSGTAWVKAEELVIPMSRGRWHGNALHFVHHTENLIKLIMRKLIMEYCD